MATPHSPARLGSVMSRAESGTPGKWGGLWSPLGVMEQWSEGLIRAPGGEVGPLTTSTKRCLYLSGCLSMSRSL